MEITVSIIASVAAIITALISASAYIRGKREEAREKAKAQRDSVRRRLALNVVGYFCEESLFAEELAKYTNETPKQVKERLRKKAERHDDNKEQFYPSMTAKEASRFIIE